MVDLSRRDKKVLIAGTIFLFVFCLVQFVYLPAVDKRDALQKKTMSRAQDIDMMRALQKRYHQHVRKFDQEKFSLEKRDKNFTLFSFLDAQSEKSHVKKNVVYMKPFSQEMENSDYTLSRVTVKLSQVYLKGLVDFLFRIENSPNSVFVTSLSLTKTKDRGGSLDAVIEAQTLTLNASALKGAASKAGASKGGPENKN